MSVRRAQASEIEWEDFAALLTVEIKEFFEPNLYLYDAYPAESDSASRSIVPTNLLLERTRELIERLSLRERMPFLRRAGR